MQTNTVCSHLERIRQKKHELADIFRTYPAIVCVYVFGSQVTGQVHEGSDIDFALLLTGEDKFENTLTLAYQVEKLLGFAAPVEITILNEQDVFFQQSVLEQGRIICCSDETVRVFFEMDVMKRHANLEPHWRFLEPFIEKGIRWRLRRASS